VRLRVRPLTLAERGIGRPPVSLRALLAGEQPPVAGSTDVRLEDYVREIISSGLPGLRGYKDRALRAALDGYIARIVERDFPEMGRRVRNAPALRRWMASYASMISSTASFESIRDAATGGRNDKPSRNAVAPYLDILEALWIIEPVPAWLPTGNRVSRLGAAPKHQLFDPAIAARLLNLHADGLMRTGTYLGALFESLVTLCVRVYAQAAEATVLHLRTREPNEHEVDLIVERGDRRVLAIEVKLARTVEPHDLRHLRWLRERIGDDLIDVVVVTTGTQAYRQADGIAVVPAALLGP
jgi:predicted AAA+ superfamily ATPase